MGEERHRPHLPRTGQDKFTARHLEGNADDATQIGGSVMGFRSMVVSSDYPIHWPGWFAEKYASTLHVPVSGPLSSRHEHKVYGAWSDLAADVQKAIDWNDHSPQRARFDLPFRLCFFHECGGVTVVKITRDTITYSEPESGEWQVVEAPTHSYCDGCSDPRPKS